MVLEKVAELCGLVTRKNLMELHSQRKKRADSSAATAGTPITIRSSVLPHPKPSQEFCSRRMTCVRGVASPMPSSGWPRISRGGAGSVSCWCRNPIDAKIGYTEKGLTDRSGTRQGAWLDSKSMVVG